MFHFAFVWLFIEHDKDLLYICAHIRFVISLISASSDYLSVYFPFMLSGIYGVGQAAEHPPALAVLSHTPDGATQTIAWVGKGIVYDTGGLSIKGKVLLVFLWRCDCICCTS